MKLSATFVDLDKRLQAFWNAKLGTWKSILRVNNCLKEEKPFIVLRNECLCKTEQDWRLRFNILDIRAICTRITKPDQCVINHGDWVDGCKNQAKRAYWHMVASLLDYYIELSTKWTICTDSGWCLAVSLTKEAGNRSE